VRMQMHVLFNVRPLMRIRHVKERKMGNRRKGIIRREGIDRFTKVFPYARSIAHEFFRVPLKSAAQTRELLTEPRMSAAKQAPPYVADFTP